MKKTLILTTALVCAAFTVNAALVADSWTSAGGAWDPGLQTGFSGGNGSLFADTGSTGGGTLVVSGGSYGNSLGGGFFYTLFTSPTFTYSVDSVVPGISSIVLEFKASAVQDPTLFYANGTEFSNAYTFVPGAVESVPTPIGPQDATVYTYTWDVSSFDFSEGFDIVFTAGNHNAFFEISVEQVAVPEPSTYALLAGGLGLAATVVIRRRRRA